jgi:hypothetical protein
MEKFMQKGQQQRPHFFGLELRITLTAHFDIRSFWIMTNY